MRRFNWAPGITENLFNKWNAFRSHFAKFTFGTFWIRIRIGIVRCAMCVGRMLMYIYGIQCDFCSRNRYDEDNSNIKFQTTRKKTTTNANSVVWNGYSVAPWYTHMYSVHTSTWIEGNFASWWLRYYVRWIRIFPLYRACVHEDSFSLLHFHSLSMWIRVVVVVVCYLRKPHACYSYQHSVRLL